MRFWTSRLQRCCKRTNVTVLVCRCLGPYLVCQVVTALAGQGGREAFEESAPEVAGRRPIHDASTDGKDERAVEPVGFDLGLAAIVFVTQTDAIG